MADDDDDTTKPKAAGSGSDGSVVDYDGHEEAAEILANLVQNQAAYTSSKNGTNADAAAAMATKSSGNNSAQDAAIQQMLQQLKLGGAAALPSDGGGDAEKKHAFWDTQVRFFCSMAMAVWPFILFRTFHRNIITSISIFALVSPMQLCSLCSITMTKHQYLTTLKIKAHYLMPTT